MKRTGASHHIPRSATFRILVLSAVLMLTLACVADLAHAAGAGTDGCPQAKLESQRSPATFLDAAVLPDRVHPSDARTPSGVVLAYEAITPPTAVSAMRTAPRAPPVA